MSTDILTPSTEIEAVNALLAAIGESPVDTLLGVLPVDAAAALTNLRRFSRQLQKSGWSFNTEIAYRLTPSVNGEIILPANTLKVDPSDVQFDLVQRGLRLYDPVAHTYAIGKPVVLDLVIGLPFEELPETARSYIMASAGLRFQDQFLGDATAHSFSEKDVKQAWSEFLSDEAENEDLNVLDAPTPQRILRLRSRT
ncbi:hypothetical protein [Roseixanthobacter pseudopolyaromaticivorans]|uniref:hypothetical protein n=1 Tax=Xanthobacteraceae TaxID=335928 RepID=UPI00372B30AB